jgi:hypothetical protein
MTFEPNAAAVIAELNTALSKKYKDGSLSVAMTQKPSIVAKFGRFVVLHGDKPLHGATRSSLPEQSEVVYGCNSIEELEREVAGYLAQAA